MLQNWLKPLSASALENIDVLGNYTIGKNLLLHRAELPVLRKVRVALLGISEHEAAPVRESFYPMVHAFPKGSVADLGNLRKSDPAVLIPVLRELLNSKIVPIVLGAEDHWARAQFLAYQETKALANLMVIDESPRFSGPDDAYTALLQPRHAALFHYALIGYQIHQSPPDALALLQQYHFEAIRLGRSRGAMEETEPVLRDADMVAFHLTALKQSEAPGVAMPSPAGFTLEEACQLARYAGLSDKLSSFGLYGFQAARDRDRQTAQVAAQLVWYFTDGFFNRKNDYPASKDGLTEYVVDFRKLNYQLTFWKSVKSGRWWMQVPVATKRKLERHRLVPCSYQDYQAACREELPERLMAALQRFD